MKNEKNTARGNGKLNMARDFLILDIFEVHLKL